MSTRILIALVIAVCAFVSVGPRAHAAEGLSAQDYTEIAQLYARYNLAIDSGDGEAYASTFTPDGVFMNNAGHDALVAFVQQWRQKMGGAHRRHWNSNLSVSGSGGRANGSVYLMLVDIGSQPQSIAATATYVDELVKTPAGWRFSKRVVKPDGVPPGPAGK